MQIGTKTLCALAGTLLLMSCVTRVDRVSLESNMDPSFDEPLSKLYVVVDTQGTSFDEESLEHLRTEIERRFPSVGVQARVLVLTGLELDEDRVERGWMEFGAQHTLSIRREGEKVDVRTGGYIGPAGYWVSTSSTRVTSFYDASISDAARGGRIWRSRITLTREFDTRSADELIDDLFVALQGDGLLDVHAESLEPVATHREFNGMATLLVISLLCSLIPLAFLFAAY